MKKRRQKGFFDETFRLEQISQQGDPLEKLNSLIDWEVFRPVLEQALQKPSKGPGGRPAFDYVKMLKILVLQRMYNLSDAQMQYQLLDRFSFMRFIGFQIEDAVPDQNTIWHFREQLTNSGVIEELFALFNDILSERGIIAHQGSIVDASFVEVPRQRNSRSENQQIRNGKVPEEWEENPAKRRQKDTDARWARKGGERHFGYKDHIKICKVSKIICSYDVTDASVHDSQVVDELLEPSDAHHELFGDSAYSGVRIKKLLREKGIRNRVHEKGYRNRPLTKNQKERNNKKSRSRARVEHVFAYIKQNLNSKEIRSIGIRRARGLIGLIHLTYNMFRYMHYMKLSTA